MNINTIVHFNSDEKRQVNTLINFFSKVLKKKKNIECHDIIISKSTVIPASKALRTILFELYYNKLSVNRIKLNYNNDVIIIEKIKKVKKNKSMKIKFKNTKDIDFNSLFPKIDKSDYLLLENMEIILNDSQVKKVKKDKYFEIGDYKLSIDTFEFLNKEGHSEIQMKVQEKLNEKFIFSEEFVDVFMTGVSLNKNMIFYGKGGHGKSEMTELIVQTLQDLGVLKEKPFVQAFGDGLTEDRLLGGTDIKKYRKDGIIEYLLHNSFLEHEVVIFEEIFDAPPQVLLTLKDILTSGYYRNGNIQHKCKTKLFIGLTNKSKEDFAEKDDSLKALAERFPLTLQVEWKSYSKNNFLLLFKTVLGENFYKDNIDKLTTLSNILDMNNMSGESFVSPRTAIHAASIYCEGKNLEYISDIDKKIIQDYNKKIKDNENNTKQDKLIKLIEDYISDNELELIHSDEDFFNLLNQIHEDSGKGSLPVDDLIDTKVSKEVKKSKANYIHNIINRVTPTSKNFKTFSSLNKKIENIMSQLDKDISNKTNNDEQEVTESNAI